MKYWLFILTSLAFSMALNAQDERERPYNGSGHVYYALGGAKGSGAFMGVGVGGEGLVYRGLGLGADIGYLFPARDPAYGVGLLSVNPSYHFVNRRTPGKVIPFVTAGYAAAFRSGGVNLWNYGGGATIWLKDWLGVRLEVRDYRDRQYQFNTSFRVSLAFR